MKRILLTVEYDGTNYSGWQRQTNAVSVQQRLEEALQQATHKETRVTGASRTDAGVHALAQAVHFDTDSTIPPERFPFVLNTMLPPDIRVHTGCEVPSMFHARFLTDGKRYTYRILNARHGSAIRRNTHWHVPVPLQLEPMREALPSLLGVHDFAAFQAAGGTAKTTIREIRSVQLTAHEDEIILTIEGTAFLYNMVRMIAGTLYEIGCGKRGPDAFAKAIASGNRLDLGQTAPAHGLELTKVYYTEQALTHPESLRRYIAEEN